MSEELDRYRRVLLPGLRAVWPLLAEATHDIDGYLVGGTALATHLQHRKSFDLDFMAHQPFSGTDLFETLSARADHVLHACSEPNRMHATINGVAVEVFAVPVRGEHPGHVKRLAPPEVIAGLRVASLADLLAMKLDVVMYRPRLRDYMDLAAIDNSGLLRLEDGLQLHMRRYGTQPQSSFIDRIIDRIEDPGGLTADAEFASHAPAVLGHLAGRAGDLRSHIRRLRKDLHYLTAPPSRQTTETIIAPATSSARPPTTPAPPEEDPPDAGACLDSLHTASLPRTQRQSVPSEPPELPAGEIRGHAGR